jgi:hypothetical protein
MADEMAALFLVSGSPELPHSAESRAAPYQAARASLRRWIENDGGGLEPPAFAAARVPKGEGRWRPQGLKARRSHGECVGSFVDRTLWPKAIRAAYILSAGHRFIACAGQGRLDARDRRAIRSRHGQAVYEDPGRWARWWTGIVAPVGTSCFQVGAAAASRSTCGGLLMVARAGRASERH